MKKLKRLFTLALICLLVVTGVFPAFAFNGSTQSANWTKPDGWTVRINNEGTLIPDLAIVATGTGGLKNYDFVLPVYVSDNGSNTCLIGADATVTKNGKKYPLKCNLSYIYVGMASHLTYTDGLSENATNIRLVRTSNITSVSQYGIYGGDVGITPIENTERSAILSLTLFNALYAGQSDIGERKAGVPSAYDLIYTLVYELAAPVAQAEGIPVDDLQVTKIASKLKESSVLTDNIKSMMSSLYPNGVTGDGDLTLVPGTTVDGNRLPDTKRKVLEGLWSIDHGSQDSSGDQTEEGDKVEQEETTADKWYVNWYKAAYKVMSGSTDWGGFDDKYKTAAEILNEEVEGDEYEHWKRVYDILSLAYSGFPSVCDSATATVKLSAWDSNRETLKQAFEKLSEAQGDDGGTILGTDTRFEPMMNEVKQALTSSTADNDIVHIQTIRQRLLLLYMAIYQGNASASSDLYDWVDPFYSANNKVFVRADDVIKQNEDTGDIQTILTFSGSLAKSYPRVAKDVEVSGDMPYLMAPYLMQTVWEVGYLRDYMIRDMNAAILNGTVMEHEEYYKMLKNLNQVVDELGMPALTKMWEDETSIDGADELQYKSLRALYEACLNDAGVKEHEQNADTTVDEEPEQLSTGKPMPAFFENYTDNRKLSENYLKGLAYTATLVPMKSNVYSDEWLNYLDRDFRENFYDLYGFNRKALYRDMTAGAGEEYFNSGKVARGALELCTLRDLIDSKGDIVLYLDDNFYNAKDIKESQSILPTYKGETTTNEAGETVTAETPWYSNIAASIEETYNTNFDSIAKTNESSNYSKIYYNMMNNLQGAHTYYPEATVENPGNTDNAVLNSGKINYYLNPGQDGSEVYSPLQGYAVISSVYRDGEMFNLANNMDTHAPVFVSSKTAAYAKGASLEQKCTLYNYAMVMNLEESMPVGYLGNLDMDCPLYMDILGNIVTESGTVIIPAMSNATLLNPDTFVLNNWAAGLYAIYGNGWRIPMKKDDMDTISQVITNFQEDASGKCYIPKARTLGDEYTIDMSRLATTSKETLDVLYNRTYADLKNATTGNIYNFNQFFQIAMEVMRGAPIESIDKEAEGLLTNDRLDRAGIVAAVKLEDLNKSLGTNGENSTISMPSLAFMPGFNYIALMAFKILLLAIIVINMAIVYIDAVGGHLGLHTIWKCFSSMIITMLTVLTVPAVFEVTYYQSSKALLQKEATYISMLNLEKKESGVEIGVTEVREPDIRTELFVKLEDIQVPWYELFYNSIFTDSYKTLNEMYENYARDNAFVASEDDIVVKNDGVYVSVDSVYDSSAVDLRIDGESSMRTLVQTAVDKNSTFSFYSPYYVILDALIQNVNYFNANPWGDANADAGTTEGWYAYTTKTQKGGRIKTMGLIEPYFTSSAFMESEGKDLTGMGAVYIDNIDTGYDPDPATYGMFAPANVDAIRESYWYADAISREECTKRVEYLNEQARVFVSDNKELLGKISDETFLKVMAMYLSTKHNEAFGAQKASAIEIYNLSSDDLIRMSIADRADVMLNSTLSYPRFVYAVGGTSSVFAAALLSMVTWISSVVKPVLIVVAFLTIFVSVFIFKVCLRKSDTSLYGYFITTLLLCGTNILYSLLLKLSMYLPSLGMTPFMCILVQIIVQIAYMVVLLQVVGTAFKDWRDLGAQRYANKIDDIKVGFFQKIHKGDSNMSNPYYGGTSQKSDPEKNWSFYDDMIDERRKRSR